MFETLERLILLQIGAAAITRERVQEAVNRLVEQGRIERAEGRTVVADILNRANERSSGARGLVDASVQQGLRGAGVPTRETYEDLLFRVEQLEHRVRLLEDRPVTPSPTPGGPPSTSEPSPPEGEPTSPMPPIGGVEVTSQPAGNEPDVPPGLQPGR